VFPIKPNPQIIHKYYRHFIQHAEFTIEKRAEFEADRDNYKQWQQISDKHAKELGSMEE